MLNILDHRQQLIRLILLAISSLIFVVLFFQLCYAEQTTNLSNPVNFTTNYSNRSKPASLNIKIETENPQTSFFKDVSTTGITAGSAIAGGVLGAFFANYFADKNERQKATKQEKSIKTLVKDELDRYSNFLANIENNSHDEGQSTGNYDKSINKTSSKFEEIHFILNATPRNYTKITTETTSKVFDASTLMKIEDAYQGLEVFITRIKDRNRRFDKMFYFQKELTTLIEKVKVAKGFIHITQ